VQTIILSGGGDFDGQFLHRLDLKGLRSERLAKEVVFGGFLESREVVMKRTTPYVLISPKDVGFQEDTSKQVFFEKIEELYQNIHTCTVKEALLFYSMTRGVSLSAIMDSIPTPSKFVLSVKPHLCSNEKSYVLFVLKHGQQLWLKAHDSSSQEIPSREVWVFVRR
jgi:hypothetical protein